MDVSKLLIVIFVVPAALFAVNIIKSHKRKRVLIISLICLAPFVIGLFALLLGDDRDSIIRDNDLIKGGLFSRAYYVGSEGGEELFCLEQNFLGGSSYIYYSLPESSGVKVSGLVKLWKDVSIVYPKVKMPLDSKTLTRDGKDYTCYILPEGTRISADLIDLWVWLMVIGLAAVTIYNASALIVRALKNNEKKIKAKQNLT